MSPAAKGFRYRAYLMDVDGVVFEAVWLLAKTLDEALAEAQEIRSKVILLGRPSAHVIADVYDTRSREGRFSSSGRKVGSCYSIQPR